MATTPFFDEPNMPDATDMFRRSILRVMFVMTVTLGIPFEVFNYQHGVYGLLTAEICMSFFSIALFPIVGRTRHLARVSLLYLLLFNSVMMYALNTPMAGPTVFSWVLLVPVLSFLLLGRRVGTVVIVFFSAVAAFIYYRRFGGDARLGSFIAIGNVVGTAISVFAVSFAYEISRARAEGVIRLQARLDPLTGLGNRNGLLEHFGQFQTLFMRRGICFCLLVIDIDHFKSINDTHGHETGDAVLNWVANLMTDEIQGDDKAYRYGGEEFCVLIANADVAKASAVAERMRQRIDTERLSASGQQLHLTVSIGVAQISADMDNLSRLVAAADKRMYSAKQAGRNRVAS